MLITNFNITKRLKYENALKIYKDQTGDKSLYIDNNAYVRNGRRDEGMNALRCNENKDLSDFWNIFSKF